MLILRIYFWLKYIGNQDQFVFVAFKLCTNKNHSYKHNEQINKQNIHNSECFGVNLLKSFMKWLHNNFLKENMALVHYIGIFFYMRQYFWPHTVCVFPLNLQGTYTCSSKCDQIPFWACPGEDLNLNIL